ncbi:mitochondrial import receptor subunit TOM22 homolog [Amphiura filiformis]|uniref:mitochondrial import receptor subunit TOM22 homolog n=1 Tax=Amphiura filiformis TaxID=82378 RepID=UPI003B22221C
MAEDEIAARAIENEIEDDDDYEDETLAERLVGLAEMFPEGVRSKTATAFEYSVLGLKKAFDFGRSTTWIVSTSFIVLMLPVIFETEMAQMEQAQLQKQRQILLGPNAASAGPAGIGMAPPVPGAR